MSRPKFAQAKDQNHNEIADHLRAFGVDVVDCFAAGSVPDLLVKFPREGLRGLVGWIECKIATKRDVKFTHKQLSFIAQTSYAVRIVSNKDDALIFARTHEGALTPQEKARLAVFCDGADRKRLFTVGQVAAVLKGDGK